MMRPAANPENGPNRLFLDRTHFTPARPAPNKSVASSDKVLKKMAGMQPGIEAIKRDASASLVSETPDEDRALLIDEFATELEKEVKRLHPELDENHGHQATN